jgi:hypothetical protein
VVTYFPVFKAITKAANPDLYAAQESSKVTLTADQKECSFQFNPTGTAKFTTSCDVAKQKLAANSVSYDNVPGAAGTPAVIKIGDKEVTTAITPDEKAVKAAEDKVKVLSDEKKAKDAVLTANLAAALKDHGYPSKSDPAKLNKPMVIALLTWLMILVTMVYGPIAAMLVELFPTRIRYTSMSLPYHIGNGWFGGLLPTTFLAIVMQTGNMYNGLWYPIIVAAMTLVIGTLFIKETKDVDIYAHD